MRVISRSRCFGGEQLVVEHQATAVGCAMRLGVYLPPGGGAGRPVLLYLSGLTCTEQNVITKAGAQRACARWGLVLVCPDTSPRGDGVADDAAWDLGQGAGFYLDATEAPWAAHFQMGRYVLDDLPPVVGEFTDSARWGVTGHSMGGHGALVLALRSPGRFRSVSAFAPILQPLDVPWGQKAFGAYLGPDRGAWAAWDAASLVEAAPERLPLLIDQGTADPYLGEQLVATRFLAACQRAGHPVQYRLQEGYDHGYFFVSTFIDEHVAHHAAALGA